VRGDGAAVPGLDFEIGPASLDGEGGRGRSRGPGIVSLLLLAVAAAVAGLALAKLIRRRWRYRATDPRATAAACRAELVDFLADQRVSVADSATAAELAAEVRSVFGVDARPLAVALGRARYAAPGDADAAARHARRELANVRRLLSARLSRGERFRGLVSLRSLGLTG